MIGRSAGGDDEMFDGEECIFIAIQSAKLYFCFRRKSSAVVEGANEGVGLLHDFFERPVKEWSGGEFDGFFWGEFDARGVQRCSFWGDDGKLSVLECDEFTGVIAECGEFARDVHGSFSNADDKRTAVAGSDDGVGKKGGNDSDAPGTFEFSEGVFDCGFE